VIDLEDTYGWLAHPGSPDQLAACYRDANERGAEAVSPEDDELTQPLGLLATAIPRAATLSVAIHMLHALPTGARDTLSCELIDTSKQNVADVLHRCHRALELDGAAHGYTADEWLPIVYDTTAPLLQSAGLGEEPPAIVQQTEDAINWLSRAVLELDRESPETAAALTEALARLLTVWVFASVAREGSAR
jgi:hypothetical protein